MLRSPVIQVENLSKVYRIDHAPSGGNELRGVIANLCKAPLRLLGANRSAAATREDFWALRGVSFQVQPGEILGIVGRNGAGKSTLLKILSQITEPTSGQARIQGRVGSLLEVGTGFHPELSGRENIFLNGAILGMTRREIVRQFDDIVSFSGVEKFLDTPVKRYSSGMRVRLGFAVAAHLNLEILFIDEVLAVGDAEFQRRCLGRMADVAQEGRTLLFVSHNMQAVNTLCTRAILLKDGQVDHEGTTEEVVERYLASGNVDAPEYSWETSAAPGDHVCHLRAMRILNDEGCVKHHHSMHAPITLELEYELHETHRDITVSFHVYNQHETCLFAVANNQARDWQQPVYRPGIYRTRCIIPADLLNEGRHMVSAFVVQDKSRWPAHADKVISFFVQDGGQTRGGYTGHWIGQVRPVLPWTTTQIDGVAT